MVGEIGKDRSEYNTNYRVNDKQYSCYRVNKCIGVQLWEIRMISELNICNRMKGRLTRTSEFFPPITIVTMPTIHSRSPTISSYGDCLYVEHRGLEEGKYLSKSFMKHQGSKKAIGNECKLGEVRVSSVPHRGIRILLLHTAPRGATKEALRKGC